MLGILAGMDQKDYCSGICKAGFPGVSPRAVLWGSTVGRSCSQLQLRSPPWCRSQSPLNGWTIVATATVVTSYSSCCGSVSVAMSCGGVFSLLVVLTILFGTV